MKALCISGQVKQLPLLEQMNMKPMKASWVWKRSIYSKWTVKTHGYPPILQYTIGPKTSPNARFIFSPHYPSRFYQPSNPTKSPWKSNKTTIICRPHRLSQVQERFGQFVEGTGAKQLDLSWGYFRRINRFNRLIKAGNKERKPSNKK